MTHEITGALPVLAETRIESALEQSDDKIDSKNEEVQHVEYGMTDQTATEDSGKMMDQAIAGEQLERTMTFMTALKTYPQALFWCFAVSMTIIMCGFDTIVLPGVIGLPAFREQFGKWSGNEENGYQLTPQWQLAIGQISNIGFILDTLGTGYLQDRIGRRRMIQINLCLATPLIFILFFAESIAILALGEGLINIPWGGFQASAIPYVSEITPTPLRGALTSYINMVNPSAGSYIGQILAAGVLVGVQTRTDKWSDKMPFAVQWAWPVPLFILVTLAPESPWWLVHQGRLDDAKKSLRRLASRKEHVDFNQTIALMIRTHEHEKAAGSGATYWDCLRKPSDRSRAEIACMAYLIQTLAGAPFGYQGVYFFGQAAFGLNLAIYIVGMLGTTVAWWLMTKFGRRYRYLYGCCIMSLFLILSGLCTIPSNQGIVAAKWAEGAMSLCWVFTYSTTIGPLGFCIMWEISSTRLRSKTNGLANVVPTIIGIPLGFLTTYMLNPLAWNWKGYYAFFWLGSCLLCIVWIYFRLPERAGRSFRELDILFEKNVPARQFKHTHVSLVEEDTIH